MKIEMLEIDSPKTIYACIFFEKSLGTSMGNIPQIEEHQLEA